MSAEIRRLLDMLMMTSGGPLYAETRAQVERELQALLPPPGPEAPPAPSATQLVEQWREEARVADMLVADYQQRKVYLHLGWARKLSAQWKQCADQLEAALKGVPLVEQDEDDHARVAPGATMPSTGSTAKSATGDKSS